jgi:hypothetical protein
MNLRLRLLTLLLLPALVTAFPTGGLARKDKPAPGKDKPRLTLIADPAFGFTPVFVTLRGHLTGVDLHDRNFCHAAITWVRIDPGQTEDEGFKVREAPACVHPDEEISVTDTFTRSFELYAIGSYLIRLEIQGKDGTRIVSAYTRVQVLRVQ